LIKRSGFLQHHLIFDFFWACCALPTLFAKIS
jgi:hypothetical protein